MKGSRYAAWLLLFALLAGCGDDPLTIDGGRSPTYEPQLFRTLLSHLTQQESLPQDGDWPDDFGDANYYGPGFFFRYGTDNANDLQLQLAADNVAYNAALAADAGRKIDVFMDQLEEVMMAALGLMEALHHRPDAEEVEQIDKLLKLLQTIARAWDYYPDSLEGTYAIDTYGPTTMNATLALLNLEYAFTVGGESKDARTEAGLEVLDNGAKIAFDSERGYYRFNRTSTELYLYPNVTQLLAHVRAYQLTEQKKYLQRAEALYAAIQPLKVKEEARYRSPYSAKHMGAKTDDYTTLSSQNYTMIALAVLYSVTKEQRYKQEVLDLLGFIRRSLVSEGRALHHWMDGRLAEPKDPEYYCSGCNLQTLYLIWRLEEFFKD